MPSVLLVAGGQSLLATVPALVEAGFEVAYEGTSDEALERLRTYSPDVAVLPTPDATPELYSSLRAIVPACRVLCLVTDEGAAPLGPDATIASPADTEGLVAAIWGLSDSSWAPQVTG